MDSRNPSDPMVLLWPQWKPAEVGRGKHADPTKSSPRNVPVLPLEIIDIILRETTRREAWKYPLRREERLVLTACTLVCKSWLPIARRLLYHSVVVATDSTVTSWSPGTLGLDALLQRSRLLGFTRSLSIYTDGNTPVASPLFSEDEGARKNAGIPDFFLPLAYTPQLQYLMLYTCWTKKNIGQFEPHVLDWLSSLVLPVEVLDIHDFDGAFSHAFVYDLVGIWPMIRALRVSGDHGPPPERASIRLRELSLSAHPSTTTLAFIEWLLPPPPPDEQSILRFLSLFHIPEEVRAVLSVHGPSVSTLELKRQPGFEIGHLFTNLEELVISLVRGRSWSSPLPAFPRTLKHIRLVCGRVFIDASLNLDLDCVVFAVAQAVPVLPDLRIISIDEKFIPNKHYPDLQRACETHRVEILVALSVDGKPVHPYHAEMDRFPRQYTFAEFFDVRDRRH